MAGGDNDVVWNVVAVKLPEFTQLTGIEAHPQPYADL